MKRFALLPLGLLMIASCKENGPLIDFTPKASDTAYMGSVESPQPRMVLVEEFTGVKCPNCPTGHAALKAIEDDNKGRIAAIGIQVFNNPQTKPVDDNNITTMHDNRTQAGTDLQSAVYSGLGSVGMPSAGIDRVLNAGNGTLLYETSFWSSRVKERLALPTSVNISVAPAFDASSRTLVVKVRASYTAAVSASQLLSVAIVEDDVIDAQEFPSDFQQSYSHQHVLRDFLTAATGSPILSGKSIAAGQVYERTFVYTMNADWNPDHCRLVASVSNSTPDKEVRQAADVAIK